jgi:hypothetical protein
MGPKLHDRQAYGFSHQKFTVIQAIAAHWGGLVYRSACCDSDKGPAQWPSESAPISGMGAAAACTSSWPTDMVVSPPPGRMRHHPLAPHQGSPHPAAAQPLSNGIEECPCDILLSGLQSGTDPTNSEEEFQ